MDFFFIFYFYYFFILFLFLFYLQALLRGHHPSSSVSHHGGLIAADYCAALPQSVVSPEISHHSCGESLLDLT